MKCYNCGAELSEEDFCTKCGADVVIYKKIVRASNFYYNEGLEKAKLRDLSGAINSLRESLKFDKTNVNARNLLGLIYYEMGEVVAALSEWVISQNIRPKKNLAVGYLADIQSNATKRETLNQTIQKYNMALKYCWQDSKDLAIIQLKSLLATNAKFVRAHQLLALLYIDAKEWQKAWRELEKCRKIDNGSTITRRYLREVEMMLEPAEGDTKGIKKADKPLEYQRGNEVIIQPFEMHDSRNVSFASIVYVILGLVIGAAITFFLILPARIQSAKAEVNSQLISVSEQLSARSADVEELEQKVKSLENSNSDLQSQVQSYVGTDGTLQSMNDLLTAVNLYLTAPEDLVAVGEILLDIQSEVNIDDAAEEFRVVYNQLMSLVGPSLSLQYLDEGIEYYNDENYVEAINSLLKAYHYDSTNIDIVYDLADAYYRNEDTEHAAIYYQQVVENFPGTQRASRAADILEELGFSSAVSD